MKYPSTACQRPILALLLLVAPYPPQPASDATSPACSPPLRSAAPAATTPDGLVSWWRGEENAADATGQNPGILVGNVTYVDGVVGRAFHFGGAGYLEVPVSLSLEPSTLTVVAWVRGPSPSPPGTYMLAKGAGTCNGNSAYAI